MNESTLKSLTRALIGIQAELVRSTDLEADRLVQEMATREMRRARMACCGNCLNFEPASWDLMLSRGRTQPYVKCWFGFCTAQTRPPTRKRGDPTERQSDDAPCVRYDARQWPDGSPVTTTCDNLPINPQEEDDDR